MKEESSKDSRYTSDQLEAVKKINKTKDYYEILGLPKSCSEEDLKKAYKKLALKLHPDKNHAPGATEAFKSINKAFSVLNDPDAKKKYEEGWDDELDQHRTYYGSPHFTFEGYHFAAEDLFTEDIFNVLFGQRQNTPNGGRFRQSSTRPTRKRSTAPASTASSQPTSSSSSHEQQQHQERRRFSHRSSNNANNTNNNSNRGERHQSYFLSSYNLLLQMSPLFFMIMLSVINTLFYYEDVYALQQDSKYSVEKLTSRFSLPFYLKSDFKEKYAGQLVNIEKQVEEAHVVGLRNKCNREKNIKESLLWKAKMYNNRALYDQTKDRKLPSCERLQTLVTSY